MSEQIGRNARIANFWTPSMNSCNAIPGVYQVDDFPEARGFSLAPIDIDPSGTLYALLDSNTVATMFEVTTTLPGHAWMNCGTRVDGKDIPNTQYGFHAISNFCIESETTLDDDANIFRIQFMSEILGDILFKHARLIESLGSKPKCCLSVYNQYKSIRIRIYRSKEVKSATVVLSIKKGAGWRPVEAYHILLRLRVFMSQCVGTFVDLREPSLHFSSKRFIWKGRMITPRLQEGPEIKLEREFPFIDIIARPHVFQTLFDAWSIADEAQDVARSMLVEVMRQPHIATISQLRDLMTAVEMLVREKTRVVSRSTFDKLKDMLRCALEDFATQHSAPDVLKLSPNIQFLNEVNSKNKLTVCLEAMSRELRDNTFEDVETFVNEAVSLRNRAAHDASTITSADYGDLGWYIAKLKLAVGVYLATQMGADAYDIIRVSQIVRNAVYYGKIRPSERS